MHAVHPVRQPTRVRQKGKGATQLRGGKGVPRYGSGQRLAGRCMPAIEGHGPPGAGPPERSRYGPTATAAAEAVAHSWSGSCYAALAWAMPATCPALPSPS